MDKTSRTNHEKPRPIRQSINHNSGLGSHGGLHAQAPRHHGRRQALRLHDCRARNGRPGAFGLLGHAPGGAEPLGRHRHPRLRMGGRRAGRMVGRHLLRLPRPPRQPADASAAPRCRKRAAGPRLEDADQGRGARALPDVPGRIFRHRRPEIRTADRPQRQQPDAEVVPVVDGHALGPRRRHGRAEKTASRCHAATSTPSSACATDKGIARAAAPASRAIPLWLSAPLGRVSFSDKVHELVEQLFGVGGAAAGLGVELCGEERLGLVADALAGAVVDVEV